MADLTNSELNSDSVNGNMSTNISTAVLIIIGEPFTSDYKDVTRKALLKGLHSWDATKYGCELYPQLEEVVNASPNIENGNNGERHFTHITEQVQFFVAVTPCLETIETQLRSLLLSGATHHHVVYAGHYIEGSGAWILQDSLFTADQFQQIFKEPDFANSLQRISSVQQDLSISLYGCVGNAWAAVTKSPHLKTCGLAVNLLAETEDSPGDATQFMDFVDPLYNARTSKELLPSSEVVGNIRFSGPTIYLFPGGQGDCALFGIAGFNLLVNGGYSKQPCFWDFTRHLDRIDALMQTHIGADNLFGMSSFIERKAEENVAPELGCVLINAPPCRPLNNNGTEDAINVADLSLGVSITGEANKMLRNLNTFKMTPTPCTGLGPASGGLNPMNLYHKVGHGTLDVYVLNPPAGGDKEMKEFFAQWKKDAPAFTSSKSIPTPNMMSICALLVWKPASETEPITRILFPGATPQPKIFEGLNKLKNCDIFQHAQCSNQILNAPKSIKKAASAPTARSAGVTAAKPSRPESAKAATTKSTKDERNTQRKSAVTASATDKRPTSAPTTAKTARTTKAAPLKKTPTPPKTPTPTKPSTPRTSASTKATAKKAASSTPLAKTKATKTPPPSPMDTATVAKTAASPEAVSSEIQKLADSTPSDTSVHIDTSAAEVSLLDASASEPISEPVSEQITEPPSEPASEQASEPVDLLNGISSPPPASESLIDTSATPSDAMSPLPAEEPAPPAVSTGLDLLADPVHESSQSTSLLESDPLVSSPLASEPLKSSTPEPEVLVPEPMAAEPVDLLQSSDLLGSHGFDSSHGSNGQAAQDAPASDVADLLSGLPTSTQQPAESEHTPELIPDHVPQEPEEAPKGLPEPVMPAAEQDFSQFGGDMSSSMVASQREDTFMAQEQHQEEALPQQAQEDLGIYDDEQVDQIQSNKHESDLLSAEAPVDFLSSEQPTDSMNQQPVDLLEQIPHADPNQAPELLDPVDAHDVVSHNDLMNQSTDNAPANEQPLCDFGQQESSMPDVQSFAGFDGTAQQEQPLFDGTAPTGQPLFDGTAPTEQPLFDGTAPTEQPLFDGTAPTEQPLFDGTAPTEQPLFDGTAPTEQPLFDGAAPTEQQILDNKAGSDQPLFDSAVPSDQPLFDSAVPSEQPLFDGASPEGLPDPQEPGINPILPADDLEMSPPIQQKESTFEVQSEMNPQEESLPEQQLPVDQVTENTVEPDVANKDLVKPQSDYASEEFVQSAQDPAPFCVDQVEMQLQEEEEERDHTAGEVTPPESDSAAVGLTAEQLQERLTDASDFSAADESEMHKVEGVNDAAKDSADEVDDLVNGNVDLNVSVNTDDSLDKSSDLQVVPDGEMSHDVPTAEALAPQEVIDYVPDTKDDSLEPTRDFDPMTTSVCMDQDVGVPQDHMQPESADEAVLAEPTPMESSDGALGHQLLSDDIDHDSLSGRDVSMTSGVSNVMTDSLMQVESLEDVSPKADDQKKPAELFSVVDGPLAESEPSVNPFVGVSSDEDNSQHQSNIPNDNEQKAVDNPEEFDPLKSWGQPMDLPAPPPPTVDLNAGTAKARTATKKLNGAATKTASTKKDVKKPDSAATRTAARKTTTTTTKTTVKKEINGHSKPPVAATTTRKARPSTDGSKVAPTKRAGPVSASKARTAGASTPAPLAPVVPFYVDLTYIPAHGDDQYSTVDFFRRIRARYYVLSALNPSVTVLNALLEGRGTWTAADAELEVTLIPTYDTYTLRKWMTEHREKLAELKITIAPSASRCSIQLQDHEASCAAYRLEF